MKGIYKLGVAAVALTVVMAGATRSEALVDDPYTSFSQPANALVMPFDATENHSSFLIVSNVAGTSGTVDGELLGVTTHWAWWNESCDHLVDVWICLTLNDTIVVDPTDITAIDAGNQPIGPDTNLSGFRGTVIVTAYATDEICSEGSIRGYELVDDAIVGSATRANTDVGYSFGNDAIGLGVDGTGSYTELTSGASSDVDVITFNPSTLDSSSVAIISLREQSGNGSQRNVEVGPNTDAQDVSLVLYDNMEVPTSLPDASVSCTVFASMIPGEEGSLIPGTVAVNSSGFLEMNGLNDDQAGGAFAYVLHGQSLSDFGGSNYGKYSMSGSDQ
jgi:hypothetical protein